MVGSCLAPQMPSALPLPLPLPLRRSRQAVPGALAAVGGGRLGRPLRCGARAKGARITRFTRFARYAQTTSASQMLKRVSTRAALGPALLAASYGDRTGHRLPLDHRSLCSLVAYHRRCSKGAWGWPAAAVMRRRAAQEARPRAYPRASTSDSRMLFERNERSECSELSAGRAFEQRREVGAPRAPTAECRPTPATPTRLCRHEPSRRAPLHEAPSATRSSHHA